VAGEKKVDVVIVGGGASGILLAAKLGQAGKKVVVLEMGPPLALEDLISSQIWSRRLKWGGVPVVSEGKNPVSHNFQSGWGLGGAAMHQYANWPRLHPEDFRVKTQYGRGLDWPISYEQLRPYYDSIQREVGLSGDHVAEVWRPAGEPYPMPPMKWFRQAEVLAEGFRKLGMRTAPMPVAINSVPYNGRPACLYDGWCEAGCPTGALVNPQVTYLPVAKKAGVEIRTDAYVTRVLTNAKGDRAIGVEYYDRNKQRQVQAADVVVLAAFSASNPRILLNSATDKHPNGLANSSGLVGRNVMAHITVSAFGLFDENVENHMGMSSAFGMCQDGYVKDSHEGFGSFTWTIGVAMKPNDILGFANSRAQVFGNALHDFMKKASRGLARIGTQCEELPNPDNRVVLSDRKDEFGFPLARVVHALDDNSMKLFEHMRDQGLRIVKATRAAETWTSPAPGLAHFLGGTIMGRNSADSVADGYGRTYDVPNLFIAGGGLFPTIGGVHPTFTLHALTLRTADYMADNWRGIAA
jgi:choline dehydrogenase-like flavoprotein